jgi:hypothetical protein
MLRNRPRRWRSFEQLEDRWMLAVDIVTAAVNAAGNLTITGDGNDDSFVVAGNGTAGDVVITGLTGTGGVNQTEIEGHQGSTPVNSAPNGSITLTGVTGSVAIQLGNGNVNASFDDLTISKALSIAGGNGGDVVSVGTIDAFNVSLPSNAITTIKGNVSIALGNGSDLLNLGTLGASSTSLIVGGSLSISLGKGNDVLDEILTSVADSESIQAGNGNDFVGVGDVAPAYSLPYNQDTLVTVGGTLCINLGNGSDSVFLGNPTAVGVSATYNSFGAIQVVLGNGADNLQQSVTDSGWETIREGGGSDSINLSDANVASLRVVGGNGNDNFSSSDVDISGSLAVALGNGTDDLVETDYTYISGSGTITLGNGNDDVLAKYFSTGTSLSITVGNGNDLIDQSDSTIGGNYSITAGCGPQGTPTDLINLLNVTAQNATVSTGSRSTDDVSIQGSSFTNLAVTLGAGAGNLTVSDDTTMHSTHFVGVGKQNTYTDNGGSSFAKLVKIGLTNTP